MKTQEPDKVIDAIAEHYAAILKLIGENPDRPGLVNTPRRAARAFFKLTEGYNANIDEVVNGALFPHEGSRMVIVKDIEFYSLCEHHILPFFGHVSVGYIPNGKILGLSKLARIVDVFARRLQVQENFTAQVCRAVSDVTGAEGVIVRCEAHHLCMKMRGVEKQDSTTVTTEYDGLFKTDESLRTEFFQSI